MDKLLIITYYWPPSGGAGVQRWLRLANYMAQQGVDVHILTVDAEKASYSVLDEGLCEDVSEAIKVYRTDTFEPLNYYAKIVGKSNVPTSGFSNTGKPDFKTRVAASIRSNIFIPDPRKGWRKYAIRKAIELIHKHEIKHVITTSPPHSVQTIGLKIKRKFGKSIKWVADLRDPWTDIYYYKLLNHSIISKRIDANYERRVVEECDVLITLGETFKKTFLSKTSKAIEDKVILIPNGYNPKNFEGLKKNKITVGYTITFTGTMADSYEPEVFFHAVKQLTETYADESFSLQMVGNISAGVKTFIQNCLSEITTFTPLVSHAEAIQSMKNADLLFLATPGDTGPVPGKIFEYLATGNPIVCIGKGDTSDILEKTKGGKAFNRNECDELFTYLKKLFDNHKNGVPFKQDEAMVQSFSCEVQAVQMREVVFSA